MTSTAGRRASDRPGGTAPRAPWQGRRAAGRGARARRGPPSRRSTWPLPPSMITRSGIDQRRSSSIPSSPARRPAEPAPQHLLVAREVVRPFDRPDPEPAVLAGPRPALLEHDHAAHRLRALEVRDVVALDAHRRPGEPERGRQLLERAERPALVGQPAGGFARERLLRVADGELHQLPLLAPLRGPQPDDARRAAAVRNASRSAVSARLRGTRTSRGTLVARA